MTTQQQRKEFYCAKCDDVYGPTATPMSECPRCNGELTTDIPPEFYVNNPGAAEVRRLPWEADEDAELTHSEVLTDIVGEVTEEYLDAVSKFGPFASPHEGYAVILEELDEMWAEIKRNDIKRAREEAVQVAAMAMRFLIDTKGSDDK
jgi:hypothetical protein